MTDERTQRTPTRRIALRCPEDVYQAVVASAAREHRTLSNMVVELTRRGLARSVEAADGDELLQAKTLAALRDWAAGKAQHR